MNYYLLLNNTESIKIKEFEESASTRTANKGEVINNITIESPTAVAINNLQVTVHSDENYQDILNDFCNYGFDGDIINVKIIDDEENVVYQTTRYNKIFRESLVKVSKGNDLIFTINFEGYTFEPEEENNNE